MAINTLSRGLAANGVVIDLLAMNTAKHFTRVDSDVLLCLSQYRKVKWVPINNQLRPIEALRSLIEGSSYHIKRFISSDFSDSIKELLLGDDYDVILLESLYMIPYLDVLKQNSQAKIVLRSHNIEFEIWDRLAENNKNPLQRWYLKKLAKSLKNYELEQLNNVDYLLPISEIDHQKYIDYGYKGRILTLPLGLDLSQYPYKKWLRKTKNIEVGFIGSLDWMPNVEGLNWFLSEVLPQLKKRFGNKIRVHLAGRNMPDYIKAKACDNIVIHGEVDHAIDYINQFPYFIVPLFSGSGMRVKILEAMALGKVVLSTSLGIEGIPATADKEFLLADTKEDFIHSFSRIIEGQLGCDIIGRNAASFMEDNFSTKIISEKLIRFLEEITYALPQYPKKLK
ncbi:glycosyltransferase family 4 protein [Membranihabitans marinus]